MNRYESFSSDKTSIQLEKIHLVIKYFFARRLFLSRFLKN